MISMGNPSVLSLQNFKSVRFYGKFLNMKDVRCNKPLGFGKSQRGKEDFCMGKDYGPFAVKLDEMEEQCRRLMGRVRL